MRNFKTDKGRKVVIDYIDWYYSWGQVRDYFDLDGLGVYICFPGDRELASIMDLDIPREGINWLLWRDTEVGIPKEKLPWRDDTESLEDYKENEEYYMKNYKKYEDKYEIRPFYISYYGSGEYRVQFCEAVEAQGMMLVKRREGGQQTETEFGAKVFEHYIEGNFLYAQCYSPHTAQFEEGELKKDHSVIYYQYEDGDIFCFDEKHAIEGIPEKFGKILPETESNHFTDFELITKSADN